MSDALDPASTDAEQPKKKKSKALLIGSVAAILSGGSAFYAVYSGLVTLPFAGTKAEVHVLSADADAELAPPADRMAFSVAPVAFVPLEEMVISLGPDSTAKHLKVRLTVEVEPGTEDEVATLTPRILDVLNTFLRAVDEKDFEIPRSMLRLRAQMLRRVQLVTPENAVRDILIQEFLLN